MIAKVAAGFLLASLAGSLILAGVGFLGFAIFAGLGPHIGTAGAAALTALILLFVPLIYIAVASLSAPRRRADPVADSALMTMLAVMIKDKPLLSLLGAGLAGAAGIWLKKKF